MFGKRIGFLKFKAEIIDKETGNKVSYYFAQHIFIISLLRSLHVSITSRS